MSIYSGTTLFKKSLSKSEIDDILMEAKPELSLRNAPPLQNPRYEDPPGDDMDEADKPPYWNELSDDQKKDIMDWEMDCYWNEYFDTIYDKINWWKYIAIFNGMVSFFLLLYI